MVPRVAGRRVQQHQHGAVHQVLRQSAASLTTVAISKCTRHERIIIMRLEITLHSEAGYIFADCSRQNRFFLQFGGGLYILC